MTSIAMAGGKMNNIVFQQQVINWYREYGRNFYWRVNKLDKWQWLVLEMLLRQTRAEAVNTMYKSFIEKYSSPEKILLASNDELEGDLKRLGLYRQRREALKLVAAKILDDYGGQVPTEVKTLASLPHVGLYASNALLCFCLGLRRPVVDVNIARVLARAHGLSPPRDARVKWIWKLAESLLPENNWVEYNYGLLDIGALFCSTKNPRCTGCSLNNTCTHGYLYRKA
ncbi:MAG: hypothetical protein H0Z40_08905 [Desulfotomaculum sp.]|nr:hypothetical protein [Desulfotomaculum sp.]